MDCSQRVIITISIEIKRLEKKESVDRRGGGDIREGVR